MPLPLYWYNSWTGSEFHKPIVLRTLRTLLKDSFGDVDPEPYVSLLDNIPTLVVPSEHDELRELWDDDSEDGHDHGGDNDDGNGD